MRSFNKISDLIRGHTRNLLLSLSPYLQHTPRKSHVRTQREVGPLQPGESLHQKPNEPESLSWTSNIQYCEKLSALFKPPVYIFVMIAEALTQREKEQRQEVKNYGPKQEIGFIWVPYRSGSLENCIPMIQLLSQALCQSRSNLFFFFFSK